MRTIYRVAAALSIVGVIYLLYPSDKDARQTTASGANGPSLAGPAFSFPVRAVPEYPALEPARSRMFEIDPNGNLVVDATTSAKLDVLLSQLPAQPSWRDLQPIEEQVKEGLPEDAARQAMRLLNDYQACRKAEAELEAQPRSPGLKGAEALLDQLIALRRARLGQQVADAMFSVQEAQARFGIQSARIEADPKLSVQERSQRIAALQKALPPGAAEPYQGEQAARAVEEQVALLRQRGAPESEVWQLRQQARGTEDAQAIAEMENQQLQWEQRYQRFAQQKSQVLATGLSEQQKQQQIELLLRQNYTDQEIDIARAYDRANDMQ